MKRSDIPTEEILAACRAFDAGQGQTPDRQPLLLRPLEGDRLRSCRLRSRQRYRERRSILRLPQ